MSQITPSRGASQGQTLSTANTKVISAADASPGSPWIGDWEATRPLDFVRILTVLAGSTTEIPGTFTFEFSETGTEVGLGLAPISESRPIEDFDTVRDFDLINAGAFYRVAFEPDGAMGGDLVFLNTTLRKQDDGAFVRLASQEIEEANAAMPQVFAYSKAFNPFTGKSTNVRASARDPNNSTSTPLDGDAVFRGIWFQWQGLYVGATLDLEADVTGTIFIDFSGDEVPTDGDESSVDQSLETAYDPAVTPLFRRTVPVQSRWIRIRYVNDSTAQSNFVLDTAFYNVSVPLVMKPVSVLPEKSNLSGIVDAVLAIKEEDSEDLTRLEGTSGAGSKYGIHAHITGIQADIPIRPATDGRTDQTTVPDAPVQIDSIKTTNRRAVKVTNSPAGQTVVIGFDPTQLRTRGEFLPAGAFSVFGIDEGIDLYAVTLSDAGGVTEVTNLNGATNGGTGASSANVLTSNDARGIISAAAQTLTSETFTYSPTAGQDEVSRVRLGIEARREPGASETAAHVSTVTGVAGNATSVVTSSSLTATAGNGYLAAVSRRNSAAVVTSVTGLGLTWVQLQDISDDEGDSRISLWQGTGTPTVTEAVTATFSAPATNCCIGASSISNVSGVVESKFFGFTGDSASYSSTINGNTNGVTFVALSMVNRTHAPTDGSTEQAEVTNGAGSNAASLAITTKASASGSNAFSGTFSGSTGWTGVAVTFAPSTILPELTVSWEDNGTPGATSDLITLTTAVDATQYVDVTSDIGTWTPAIFTTAKIIATGTTIGVADAQVDHLFFEVTDVSGAVSVVSVTQVGLDETV